jgi:glycerate kinase
MSRPLRVVVASDAIGPLDSEQAGVAIARGWSGEARVAVVPLAESGPPLARALAALLGGEPVVTDEGWWLRAGDTLAVGAEIPGTPGAGSAWDASASSVEFGRWVANCLEPGPAPGRLILDLTGLTALDGGAGLLAALGAAATGDLTAGLAGLRAAGDLALCLPASPGRGSQPISTEVIGVIAQDETDLQLLGLRGAVSRRGFAVRLDPAELLAAESTMAGWLAALGVADGPGTGAAGGAAAAVRALGGRVLRGTELCAGLAGLARTLSQADAVITGCTEFHIGNRGGQVVRFVADLAVGAQRPCLVFAGESSLSRREMRTFGVEAAHTFGPGPLPEALTAAAVRVAQGWTAAAERRVD